MKSYGHCLWLRAVSLLHLQGWNSSTVWSSPALGAFSAKSHSPLSPQLPAQAELKKNGDCSWGNKAWKNCPYLSIGKREVLFLCIIYSVSNKLWTCLWEAFHEFVFRVINHYADSLGHRTDFSTSTRWVFGGLESWRVLCSGACPVQYRMSSGSPGLYSLDANSTPPRAVTT